MTCTVNTPSASSGCTPKDLNEHGGRSTEAKLRTTDVVVFESVIAWHRNPQRVLLPPVSLSPPKPLPAQPSESHARDKPTTITAAAVVAAAAASPLPSPIPSSEAEAEKEKHATSRAECRFFGTLTAFPVADGRQQPPQEKRKAATLATQPLLPPPTTCSARLRPTQRVGGGGGDVDPARSLAPPPPSPRLSMVFAAARESRPSRGWSESANHGRGASTSSNKRRRRHRGLCCCSRQRRRQYRLCRCCCASTEDGSRLRRPTRPRREGPCLGAGTDDVIQQINKPTTQHRLAPVRLYPVEHYFHKGDSRQSPCCREKKRYVLDN